MRNRFISKLASEAESHQEIILVVGDLGFNVVEPFSEKFPGRFINAGIAEQNMLGMSAGLASEGYHVFVYSIGNFPTYRCAEQLRNDVDYHGYPVTIVSVGGGLAYGNLGYSHHAIQDYSLIRSLPGTWICAPGDPEEVEGCLDFILKAKQPTYLRLRKAGELSYTVSRELNPGEIYPARINGARDAVITTGGAFQFAMSANLDADVYTLPIWGMGVSVIETLALLKYRKIHLLEDHFIDGGFCSWFVERLLKKGDPLLQRISIYGFDRTIVGKVASEDILWNLQGVLENLRRGLK